MMPISEVMRTRGSLARHHGPIPGLSGVLVFVPLFVSLLVSVLDLAPGDAIAAQVLAYGATILALVWCAVSRRRFLTDAAWLFLLAGHAIWFALSAVYQVLAPDLWFGDWIGMPVPDAALLRAGQLISVFLAANGVAYLVVKGTRRPPGFGLPEGFVVPRAHRVFVVLALFGVGLVPYVMYGGGIAEIIDGILAERGSKAWTSGVNAVLISSSQNTFFWISRAFLVTGTVMSGAYFLLDRASGPIERLVHGGVFGLTLLIVYFDQGTRSYLAMAVLPLVVLLIQRASFFRGAFRPRRLLGLAVALAVVMVVATQFQELFRTEHDRERLDEITLLDLASPQQDIDFFTETANAVVVAEDYLPEPLHESALLFFAINPVPRVLWPEKPVPVTQWHYTLYRWGIDIFEKGGNALPSVVGQYYMGFGVLGVVWIGLVFGAFAGFLGRILSRDEPRFEVVLVVLSALTFQFLSFRYFAPSFHYATVLLFVIVSGYSWHARRARSARSGNRSVVQRERILVGRAP